jgi:hypothetical protein
MKKPNLVTEKDFKEFQKQVGKDIKAITQLLGIHDLALKSIGGGNPKKKKAKKKAKKKV